MGSRLTDRTWGRVIETLNFAAKPHFCYELWKKWVFNHKMPMICQFLIYIFKKIIKLRKNSSFNWFTPFHVLIRPDVIWKKISRPLYHVHFTVIHTNSRHNQQYSLDPFHICTSYQPTSEGVSRVMPVTKFKNLKFWRIFLICNFDFVFFRLGIQYDSMVWVIIRRRGVSSERRRSNCSSY